MIGEQSLSVNVQIVKEIHMHDCSLNNLSVFEYNDLLFVRVKEHFGEIFYISKAEYCPVCGMKGKKSHIEGMTMYPRNDIVDKIGDIETCVKDMFDAAWEGIMNEGFSELEYRFCENTIQTVLTYLRSKREEQINEAMRTRKS